MNTGQSRLSKSSHWPRQSRGAGGRVINKRLESDRGPGSSVRQPSRIQDENFLIQTVLATAKRREVLQCLLSGVVPVISLQVHLLLVLRGVGALFAMG